MQPEPLHFTVRVSTAVVTADGIETRYLRAGSGPTVLLLGVEGLESRPVGLLARALARSFRVIAPQVSSDMVDLASVGWLHGLFDGLGILEAAVISLPSLADLVLEFARQDPERVKGPIIFTPTAVSERDYGSLTSTVARLFI